MVKIISIMALPNIFTQDVARGVITRIQNLTPATPAQWGKMNVSQMLAHCNVAYEMTFENKHPKPNFFMRWMLKSFVKQGVVNEVPYAKNIRTAPAFLITGERDFEKEKSRLIQYIEKCVDLGPAHFEGKESLSFGKMTTTEWNNMFYKHLDHHLSQFGV